MGRLTIPALTRYSQSLLSSPRTTFASSSSVLGVHARVELKIRKILAWPDCHYPKNDEVATEAAFRFLPYFKPDIFIQLGDFCDLSSISRHDFRTRSEFITLEDELAAANQALDRLDESLPKNCRKIMIGGNHEDWYEAARMKSLTVPDKISRTMISWKTSWADEYELPKRGWEWCDYNERITIGKLTFTHGMGSGGAGACQFTAKKLPSRNVVFGHTHRHLLYGCHDGKDNPVEYESIGTLSQFNMPYLRGEPAESWAHGFMYIYMREDGTFTKHFVHIINGSYIVNGIDFKQ